VMISTAATSAMSLVACAALSSKLWLDVLSLTRILC
jgi:hypothetical protein